MLTGWHSAHATANVTEKGMVYKMDDTQNRDLMMAKISKKVNLARTFTPSSPVQNRDIFAGRNDQLDRMFSTFLQPGRHLAVYGERGVGKTSLVNIFFEIMHSALKETNNLILKINANKNDSYLDIWRAILSQVEYMVPKQKIGYNAQEETMRVCYDRFIVDDMKNYQIMNLLKSISTSYDNVYIVIDEFDRLDENVSAPLSELIKSLSDQAGNIKIMIVGVSSTIDALLKSHESLERCLIQIYMPRMTTEELKDIINSGLPKIPLTIADSTLNLIPKLSQGLPYYTHLLSYNASSSAIERDSETIEDSDLKRSQDLNVNDGENTIKNAYMKATNSPRKNARFRHVLLAAALTPKDDYGFFSPTDMVAPMQLVMGKPEIELSNFYKVLEALTTETRARVIEKSGENRNVRYRFHDPSLPPYVIIKSLESDWLEDSEAVRAYIVT